MFLAQLDGGDLGNADHMVESNDLPVLIDEISKVLLNLKSMHEAGVIEVESSYNKAFVHCFKVASREKEFINFIMERAKFHLGVEFYETDGHRLFEMRGASGGVVTSLVFYLMVKL